MGYHIYAIGKAIRALFADRVTYVLIMCKRIRYNNIMKILERKNFDELQQIQNH